jgi:hypothetical protein
MDEKFAIEIDHITRVYQRDEFEVRALDDVGRLWRQRSTTGASETPL